MAELFIAVGVLIALGFILLLVLASRHGREKYLEARKFEEEKRYREACYHYGLAILSGVAAKGCRERIKRLWQEHGPFDFSKEGQEAANARDHGDSRAGHALTMKIIKEVTGRQKYE